MTTVDDLHDEDGLEVVTPEKAERYRTEFAEALSVWASCGYRADNPVSVPRSRASLDLRMPNGVLSLPAMRLMDLLLGHAYAAGQRADTVSVSMPAVASYLGVGGGRAPWPGEVLKLAKEIESSPIVWHATGEAVTCPAVEGATYDNDRLLLSYRVPEPLRAIIEPTPPFVQLDLGAVRACRDAYGVRLVHLGALHGPAADRFRRHVVREWSADDLAAAVGYKRRGRVSPARLLAEALKPAMSDVAMGDWYRVGFVKADVGGDYDLDGNFCKEDPRKFIMYVFSANPRPQPAPDMYDGLGYARESVEGRRKLEHDAYCDALLRRVVDAEVAGVLDAASAADEARWVAEARAEAQADLGEAERLYRQSVERTAAEFDAALALGLAETD
jgi:hypothetical protein